MFKVDPTERPNINEVVSRLQEIAVARNVNLKSPLNILENSGNLVSNQRSTGTGVLYEKLKILSSTESLRL